MAEYRRHLLGRKRKKWRIRKKEIGTEEIGTEAVGKAETEEIGKVMVEEKDTEPTRYSECKTTTLIGTREAVKMHGQ